MDLSAALTTHISALCGHIEVDNHQATEAVGELTCDLTRAVGSYLGLQVVLLDEGHPVTFTSLDPTVQPHQIAASLRLNVSLLHVPGADANSTITFYAGVPGAFVDLAADLSYALEPLTFAAGHDRETSPDVQRGIAVDDALLPATLQSGVVGAADLSTVNRAIGILIGNGLHPDYAHAELARRAVAANATIVACANQLVRPAPAR